MSRCLENDRKLDWIKECVFLPHYINNRFIFQKLYRYLYISLNYLFCAFHLLMHFILFSSRLETQKCDQFTMDYLSLIFHKLNKNVLYSFTKPAIEYDSNEKLLEKWGGGKLLQKSPQCLEQIFPRKLGIAHCSLTH